MNHDVPPILPSAPPSRRTRWPWPYWVFLPLFAVAYTVFCFGFSLDAWGRRGETKPWWWDLAGVLAFPGLFLPPFIGAPFWGGAVGVGFLRLLGWIRRRLFFVTRR